MHPLEKLYRATKKAKGHEAAIVAARRLFRARYDDCEDDEQTKAEPKESKANENAEG